MFVIGLALLVGGVFVGLRGAIKGSGPWVLLGGLGMMFVGGVILAATT